MHTVPVKKGGAGYMPRFASTIRSFFLWRGGVIINVELNISLTVGNRFIRSSHCMQLKVMAYPWITEAS